MPKLHCHAGMEVEDVFSEELCREMGGKKDPWIGSLELSQRFFRIRESEDILHSVYELPTVIDGYTKTVSELKFLREITDNSSQQGFDNLKRSESRKTTEAVRSIDESILLHGF